MKKYWYIILFQLIGFSIVNSQELNCEIVINSEQIQGSQSVFTTLQKSITEFINNRRWSEMTISANERINCTMNILVKGYESDVLTCEITIQSRRPVYNANYTTPLINFRDQQFVFTYKEHDLLELIDGTLNSNLTAVLAYYAYLIIGYDLDSYSRLGGTPFFQAAENIVNLAQSTDWAGWKAFENSRNRYALINNLMDDVFKKYRLFFYEYHRLCLDEMTTNLVNARSRIATELPIIREANRARPSAIVITTFLDTKNDELINIFSKAPEKEKKSVVEVLSDINPTQSSRYEEILKNK